MRYLTILILLLVFQVLNIFANQSKLTTSPETVDPCSINIPVKLKNKITRHFPHYRWPKATDNFIEDINYNKQQGGNGCLGIVKADFDGNGFLDYAFLLTSLDSDKNLLVVALTTDKGWLFEVLSANTERDRLYVEAAKPGKYTSISDTKKLEKGEVIQFFSRKTGILTGTIEASGVAYFWTKQRWIHVWVSD